MPSEGGPVATGPVTGLNSGDDLLPSEQSSQAAQIGQANIPKPYQHYNYGILQGNFTPNIEKSKHSIKKISKIQAYAANTNQGLFRNYNEDRVSIILNISKPPSKRLDYWPKCSFFAVYDGHGGQNCADFLKENLHLFIIKDEAFPRNPQEAIRRGFFNTE